MTYTPGLYAVLLPVHAPHANVFGRCLNLCRQHGDYDAEGKAWLIAVAVPGAASALALEELAALGAAITECTDQEERQ